MRREAHVSCYLIYKMYTMTCHKVIRRGREWRVFFFTFLGAHKCRKNYRWGFDLQNNIFCSIRMKSFVSTGKSGHANRRKERSQCLRLRIRTWGPIWFSAPYSEARPRDDQPQSCRPAYIWQVIGVFDNLKFSSKNHGYTAKTDKPLFFGSRSFREAG